MGAEYKRPKDDVRLAVWNKTGGLCWYCGRALVVSVPHSDGMYTGNFFHVEHIHPRINGGSDHIDNLVPSCRACNNSKRNKSVEEWREYLRWVNIGKFSETQIAFLKEHGIEIPEPESVVFYFESVGLG